MIPISYSNNQYDLGLTIPLRDAILSGGVEVCGTLPNAPTIARDNLLLSQLELGNLPDNSKPSVQIDISDALGNTLSYWVAPDVLAVGSNRDYVRLPLAGTSYRKVADLFGCALPTYLISDQVFRNADLHLAPKTMTPDASMITTRVFIEHNRLINDKINQTFKLLDGAKKDIIFHSSLLALKHNLCLYGWHHEDGTVIQPVQSHAHSIQYEDYASGARLVARKMLLNQVAIDYYALLNHPDYHHLISGETAPYNASGIYL